MNNEKYLIINADDYGMNSETNRAIEELLEKGLITSTSLMTVAKESKTAVLKCSAEKYPAGVHFTLNSDSETERWQSNSGAASLQDIYGLRHSILKSAFAIKSKDVDKELKAQYSFMCDAGCKPDHADSHSGTLYGINGRMFFINAFRFCAEHDLPFRFPQKAGFFELQFGRKAPRPLLWFHKFILSYADRYRVKLLDDMLANPFSMAKLGGYEGLQKFYLDLLDNIGPGVSEIFLHPSYPLESAGENQREWQKRVFEFEFLKSGDLLEKAKECNITVGSWAQAPFK
ncbi:MAG: ChbG/HpnK family deacetylase [Acutalibacteraceae bacterium]|jgi:hypothetical protein